MKNLFAWFTDIKNDPSPDSIRDFVFDETKESLVTNPPILSNSLAPNPSLYRPLSFDEYIGQTKAKSILNAFINGTKARGKQLPHLLIHGSAGCGKTTLAKIVAKELGLKFTEIISTNSIDIYELFEIFTEVDGGVVFLDEVHALPRDIVESLYPIMEDFRYGDKVFKPFTLIGATTEPGEIIQDRKPFYDRFKNKIKLSDYNLEEMTKIVKQYFAKTFPGENIDESIFEKVAENSRFTPRIAISILETTVYMNGDFETAIDSFDILYKGYNLDDLKYLSFLKKHTKGVGISAIAGCLGTSRDNVSQNTESWLLKNSLIEITKQGRKLTEKGLELTNKLESCRI